MLYIVLCHLHPWMASCQKKARKAFWPFGGGDPPSKFAPLWNQPSGPGAGWVGEHAETCVWAGNPNDPGEQTGIMFYGSSAGDGKERLACLSAIARANQLSSQWKELSY